MNVAQLWISSTIEWIKQEIGEEMNRTRATCIIDESMNHLIDYYLLVPAGLLIFVFMFMKPRANIWKTRCFGLPSLPEPMNTLEDMSHRLSYVAGYGILAELCVRMVHYGYIIHTTIPSWGVIFDYLVTSLVFGTITYPIFAAIGSENLVGYCIGMFYSWIYTIIYCFKTMGCYSNRMDLLFTAASVLPILVCFFYLCIFFPVKIIASGIRYSIKRYGKSFKFKLTMKKEERNFQYVRELLQREENEEKHSKSNKSTIEHFLATLNTLKYKSVPGFRYPVRILGPIFAALIVIYKLSIISITTLLLFHRAFDKDIKQFISKSGSSREFMENAYHTTQVVVLLTLACTQLFVVINAILTLTNYRRNMLQIYKGTFNDDYWRLPEEYYYSSLMVSALKFSGYTVSFMAWGFFFNLIFFGIIISLPAAIITLLRIELIWSFAKDNFLYFLMPVILSISFLILQSILAKYLFLQKHGQVLAATNRKLLFNFSYYFFFMNIFIGVFSCLLAVFESATIGLLFMGRMDKSRLARYYEYFDPAYYAYLSLLRVENAHANPIMLAFVQLMQGHASSKPNRFVLVHPQKPMQNEFGMENLKLKAAKHRARLRWFRAYTLINNPSLIVPTKSSLQNSQTEENPFQPDTEITGNQSG